MNRTTTFFGGEERTFAFNLNEIEELQRQCGDVGIGTIVDRVMNMQFFIGDVYHTIRLGLIGGGEMAPTRAKELTDLNVIGKALANPDDPSSPLAVVRIILGSIMFGVAPAEDDASKKAEGAETTDTSTSQQSEQPPSETGQTPSE